MVRALVVRALEMEGGSGTEPGIFAAPEDGSRFEEIHTLENVPEQNLREIEQPEGDEEAEVRGWYGLQETHEIIRESYR